jgi:hypothetical protein
MSTKNLQIELTSLQDKNGNVYHVGKLEGPFQIDCTDGISFLIFTSDPGNEVLQISAAKEKKNEK